MKTTGLCSKCTSDTVYCIPNSLTSEADPRIHRGWTRWDIAATRYVCGQCGYLEEWIASQPDLSALTASLAQQPSPMPEPRFMPNFEGVDPSHCPACGINFGRPRDEAT